MPKTNYIVFFLLLIGSTNYFRSQTQIKPIAKFSFNSKNDVDEISRQKAKLIGVTFTKDRFDNDNNAIFFNGNKSSYINLGTYSSLKPKVGTISLWVKIEHKIISGTGALYNPIIVTKSTTLNDFYEAYAIYYMLESEQLVAVSTKDSTREIGLFYTQKTTRFTWHHLAMCYDYNNFSFYVDGKLVDRLAKKFETKFLDGDSVMIGATANKKKQPMAQWGC